jgi:hypothetical protein
MHLDKPDRKILSGAPPRRVQFASLGVRQRKLKRETTVWPNSFIHLQAAPTGVVARHWNTGGGSSRLRIHRFRRALFQTVAFLGPVLI